MAKTVKMTTGSPAKTILLFAIPMILSNLFQQFYNVTDTLIVGNYLGNTTLAAVGDASSIIFVFIQLSTGFALGGSVVISQYFGAGKNEKIRSCATTSTIFGIGLAVISTLIIWILAEDLLVLVNTPKEVLGIATEYLKYYFLGALPIFIYNSLNGVYVALGNSKTPLKFLIISSVLNILLDLLFIIVFRWGVIGAAVATAISQVVAAILAVVNMRKLLAGFPKSAENKFFDINILKTMLKFALPNALQSSIVSVGSVVVQAVINSFGAAVMAGSAAAAKVVNLASAVSINYSNAYSNYVGQNIGAGKIERVAPGLRGSLYVCGAISAFMTLILELFSKNVISWFADAKDADYEQVIEVGAQYIRVVAAFLVVFCIFMIMKATFKGAGDMGWFIGVTLLSFFIRLFLTLGFAGSMGVGVIWWAICLGWVISLAVTAMRYFQGGWKTKKVK